MVLVVVVDLPGCSSVVWCIYSALLAVKNPLYLRLRATTTTTPATLRPVCLVSSTHTHSLLLLLFPCEIYFHVSLSLSLSPRPSRRPPQTSPDLAKKTALTTLRLWLVLCLPLRRAWIHNPRIGRRDHPSGNLIESRPLFFIITSFPFDAFLFLF